MIRLDVSAHCLRCPWQMAGPGSDWPRIDNAAAKHTRSEPGHPTAVTATPVTGKANTSTEGKRP